MFRIIAVALPVLISGCSVIPDIPRDRSLPLQQILEHAACELQDAFRSLTTPQYKRFKAEKWLISIKLTPKIDTDVTANAGLSKKYAGAAAGKLITWTLGTPGVQLNAKGNRTGGITYTINSGKLIADTTMQCDRSTRAYHALARHLGIGEWLRRTVSAMDGTSVTELDGPTYSSQITIKYSANGGYSFTFPQGSDVAGLAGSYSTDETLGITMSEIKTPKSFTVVTLPSGGTFPDPKATRVGEAEYNAVEAAKARTELLHLEQAIRGLRLSE